MLPTELFTDSPESQDSSSTPLSNDVETWPEEIITKLKERIPDTNGMNTVVKFMKEDPDTGTATGSILVSNGKKSGVIPVIIKDFAMKPLDVFIADNKLLPLNPDYFKAVFSNNEMFQKIEEYPSYGGLGRFEDGNLWNVTYPPSLGRYAYASAKYPVLEAIASSTDGGILKKALLADTNSAVRFHKNGHAEIIKKVANLQPVNMNEFAQGVDNLVQRNISMLRREGPNKYTILSNADDVFSPIIKQVKELQDLAPYVVHADDEVKDVLNEVDQNGEKIVCLPTAVPSSEIYIEGGVDVHAEAVNEFDHYVVKKKDGTEVTGIGIPKVIDFDMNVVPTKIFIGKTMSTIQTEIAGVRLTDCDFTLPFGEPQVGQTGCFVYMPDKSHGLASIPVTIKSSVIHQFGNNACLKATDLLGNPIKLKIDASDMSLARFAKIEGDTYMVPKSMKWVPMQGFYEVSNSPIDYAVKTAGERKTGNPVHLFKTGSTSYAMRGVDKYAAAIGWDKSNLEGYQARFLLASLGADSQKIASIVKAANEQDVAVIHGLRTPLTKQEKVARAIPMATKMVGITDALKSDLIKAASHIENSQTVDVLLSLNFVNPENVSKFVSKIPSFKSAISNLASCLVASRLGIQEIPEESVSSAMARLIEVVNGLEALRSTQEG